MEIIGIMEIHYTKETDMKAKVLKGMQKEFKVGLSPPPTPPAISK